MQNAERITKVQDVVHFTQNKEKLRQQAMHRLKSILQCFSARPRICNQPIITPLAIGLKGVIK